MEGLGGGAGAAAAAADEADADHVVAGSVDERHSHAGRQGGAGHGGGLEEIAA
jgi:hypothetical protein